MSTHSAGVSSSNTTSCLSFLSQETPNRVLDHDVVKAGPVLDVVRPEGHPRSACATATLLLDISGQSVHVLDLGYVLGCQVVGHHHRLEKL